jgi:hypothetical protein
MRREPSDALFIERVEGTPVDHRDYDVTERHVDPIIRRHAHRVDAGFGLDVTRTEI